MKKLTIIFMLCAVASYAQQTVTIQHKHYTTTFSEVLLYPVLVTWTLIASDVHAKGTPHYIDRNATLSF